MSYQVKQSTIEFLTEWEFKSYKMYYDSSNFPTIGIGHLIRHKNEVFENKKLMYDILTDKEVNDLLLHDLNDNLKVIQTIEHKIKGVLNQNQVDALTAFIFNEGTIWNGLMNILNLYENDYVNHKSDIILKWISYNTSLRKINAGLINRRHAEVDLFFSEYKTRSFYSKAYTKDGVIINDY